jgi:rRNA maturation endonuclease Nob1
MAQFKVKVKVMAAVEYEMEVDASSEADAEQEATTRANVRDHLPSDFKVDYGYITDTEIKSAERLTYICENCEVEYKADVDAVKHPDAIQPWHEDDDYCAVCGAQIEAEEAKKKAGTN